MSVNFFHLILIIFFIQIPYPLFLGNELKVAFMEAVKKVIPALNVMETPDIEAGVTHAPVLEAIWPTEVAKVRTCIYFVAFIVEYYVSCILEGGQSFIYQFHNRKIEKIEKNFACLLKCTKHNIL